MAESQVVRDEYGDVIGRVVGQEYDDETCQTTITLKIDDLDIYLGGKRITASFEVS